MPEIGFPGWFIKELKCQIEQAGMHLCGSTFSGQGI